jgi:hypothetical protein
MVEMAGKVGAAAVQYQQCKVFFFFFAIIFVRARKPVPFFLAYGRAKDIRKGKKSHFPSIEYPSINIYIRSSRNKTLHNDVMGAKPSQTRARRRWMVAQIASAVASRAQRLPGRSAGRSRGESGCARWIATTPASTASARSRNARAGTKSSFLLLAPSWGSIVTPRLKKMEKGKKKKKKKKKKN